MACGCKGSTAQAQPSKRRQAQTREQRAPRPPVSFGDPGFTWTGPAGAAKQGEPAAPRR